MGYFSNDGRIRSRYTANASYLVGVSPAIYDLFLGFDWLRLLFIGLRMKGAKTLFSSASDEWSTPQDLFDWLNFMFQFTLDPCATAENTKVLSNYFIKSENGLVKSWRNERVFCNPPYSEVELWAQKAATEADTAGALVALLVPARTDTKWFQKYCIGRAIIFLKGRLKFGGHKNSAPFPSVVVLFFPKRTT